MFQAGVATTDLTPYWGVELTGWGYYIERRWREIHDRLRATALYCHDGCREVLVIALDLMVVDEAFTRRTREQIASVTGLMPESILLTCSHSHNTPAAGGLRGVGECDPFYEQWAAKQAATAGILAWRGRASATAACAHAEIADLTFNRTRPNGQIDTRLSTLRLDRMDGSPLAMVVGFQAHPCIYTELMPWTVTRDVPGEVCDKLELAYPGMTALYLQGACGDVNFLREMATPERCHEPADRLVKTALALQPDARRMGETVVAAASERVKLPTRRWTREEIAADRAEAERRLRDEDWSGWRETIGRSMTNRPDDMVKRHGGDEAKAVRAMCQFHMEWTTEILKDLDTRPEWLETEVQAVRVGDVFIAANSSEFFTPFALDVRQRANVRDLMFACYANGRIGYLPDAYDIGVKSYAGFQSPKYCNQFPFVAGSGHVMCDAMVRVISECERETMCTVV